MNPFQRLYDWWHQKHIPHFCPTCFWYQATGYKEPYDPTVPHKRFCRYSSAAKVDEGHCLSWKYEPVVEYRKNYGIYSTVKGGRPVAIPQGVCAEVGSCPPNANRTKRNQP